ncbi:MAG TPA: D-2-hydroxyacid dehydrogenase [Desulfobacteria bacterium]|nr:D-2-hydroxyacid dehydrogenase [Desulfobacteria bacterium]
MEIRKILVTGRLYRELEELLKPQIEQEIRCLPEDQVSTADLHWADVFVAFRPTPNYDDTQLKWVHCLGAGVDSFLFGRQWRNDILLTRTVCSFGSKISQYVLGYVLRDLQVQQRLAGFQRRRHWQPLEPVDISTQRFVVFGTGVIGQAVAASLSHFGGDVSGISRSGQAKPGFKRVVTLSKAKPCLSGAHWLVNTLPLTVETENLFDARLFQGLDNAAFINVGRGASVDECALDEALDRGRLRQAILDVFREEPLPEAATLWNRDDVVITPHIAAVTSAEEAAACFLTTLSKVEANMPLSNCVNVQRGY